MKNHTQKLRPLLFANIPEIIGNPKIVARTIDNKISSGILVGILNAR